MTRNVRWVLPLIFIALVAVALSAQETTPSLADLARKQREKKKEQPQSKVVITSDTLTTGINEAPRDQNPQATPPTPGPASGTTVVESAYYGIRLVVPASWKVETNTEAQFILGCGASLCTLQVSSQPSPRTKMAITAEDRNVWKDGVLPKNSLFKHELLSAGDTKVAGHPAYEIVVETPNLHRRAKHTFVLDSASARVYHFDLSVSTVGPSPSPAFPAEAQTVTESYAPIGQPHEKELQTVETLDKLPPDEKRAARNLFGILWNEVGCKPIFSRYLTLDEAVKGCKGNVGGGSLTLEPMKEDPRRDGNYSYGVQTSGGKLEITAVPNRKGLGGFYFNGEDIHYNSSGAASAQDQVLDVGLKFWANQ